MRQRGMLRNLCCHVGNGGDDSLVGFSFMPGTSWSIVLPVTFLITGDIHIKKKNNKMNNFVMLVTFLLPAAEFTLCQ